MPEHEHAELENSVAALVMGAADEDEVAAVRTHLAGCAACRQLAGRLQQAADALPLTADLIQPPPRLKSGILAAAAASARAPLTSPQSRTRIMPLRRRISPDSIWARRWAPRLPTVAVATLAVAVLVLSAWNLQLLNQARNQPPPAGVASTTLVGHGEMSGAQATVVDFQQQQVALVTFNGMPPPATGKIYELWLIPASGAPEAAAVFEPDSGGSKTLILTRDLRRYKVMAVTLEQGPDGVSAPTQTPSLSGNTV